MIEKNQSPAATVNKFKRLARHVISHHFGSAPRRIKFKASGLTNFVFDIGHAEGNFVVRISPDAGALNSFIKEQWAQSAATKCGVPTAEILEVGSSVIPFPYMISGKVDGIDGLRHPRRQLLIREMGRLAARVNSVATKGFGETFDWSNNTLSLNASWKDYVAGEYNFEAKLRTLEKNKLITPAHSRQLRRIVRQSTAERVTPALCHGDIRLKNVLADSDGKITALLDWESATSNIAPQWELSLALHDLGIDEKQHFLEGYGLDEKRYAEMAPLIKSFNLLNYAGEIDRAAGAKDKVALGRIKARFSGVFDLYSVPQK